MEGKGDAKKLTAGAPAQKRGKGGSGVVGGREGMEGRSDTKLEGGMGGKVAEKITVLKRGNLGGLV